MIGQRFDRLVVLGLAYTNSSRGKVWACQCDCGKTTKSGGYSLTSGKARSCGCIQKEVASRTHTTHGHSRSKIYRIWHEMINRCTNPKNDHYHNYGGRGITVSEDWMVFENFLRDVGEKPDKLQLDRIDNNAGYSKDNCRWVDARTNINNRRNTRFLTFQGETLPLTEWARRIGMKKVTLIARLYTQGLSIEEALTTPVKKRTKW